MTLDPQTVENLFKKCVSSDGKPVEGIMTTANLATQGHEGEIAALLSELPDEFHQNKGGGWSFLNACNDRHGRLWTGMHGTMEQLLMLGIAAGQVSYLLPRDMWSVLPGGMPYFVISAPDNAGASTS